MDFDFDKKLADIDFSQLGAEDIHKMLKKYIDSIELPSITPDMFLAIVKKFVYRTMINRVFEYELMYMERKSLDVQKGMEFCKELFDHSPEMSDYFTSPEELMQDIYRFLKMPQNSSFLGMKDSLNLLANLSAIKSQKDVKFFPLLDFYAKFYQTMIGEKDDDVFEQLVAKSIGNALYRKYKNDFVVLPVDFLLERMKKSFEEQEGAEMPKEDVPPEFSQRTISFEECFELYSEFFDEEFDGELLKEVKTELRILNCVKPVRKHRNYYCRIYVKLYHWNWTLEKLFDQKVLDAARLANPFVRFWEPEKAPFKVCFAKELEIALESAMKTRYNKSLPKDVKLFEIESEEDRKIGILRTVEYPEFKKILRALKLTVDDFHIIDDQFKSTSKLTEIPVITPYGTYCKFARDSLKDIFDQVSCGMNLLKAVSKENYPKIVTWFEELFDDVFDHKRDYVYFVETWKTDEIIDKAYQDLQQYATETVYKIPDKLRDIELPDYQVISELKKFFPNFPTQEYMDLAIRQVVGMIPMMKKLKSETPFAEHNYGREMQLYFEFASFLAFTADNIVFKAFIMRQERKRD
ncbi:unnamed protein product [Caenorhabditis angaria]|uniref:Uncharacterized protein n=1 Tax=Caenorhabditis angaria TaxID=860376 RepID=A0A9P1I9Y3_9PELO|nr:unnamed protein product [Caenorhabditis angaria]